jgi:GNAT superfamily N-acetyltransferase
MKEAAFDIRDTLPEDVSLLAHLIHTSFRDVAQRFALTRENCPKHPSNCTVDWIDADLKRGVRYFILENHDVPAGCVGIEQADPNRCYLERLAVLPRYRGQGYGQALVRYVLEWAGANGLGKVGIGIIAKQTELKRWYVKQGFKQIEIKEFAHLSFQVGIMEYDIERL